MLMVCGIFGCLGHAFSRSPSSASLSTAEQQHHHGAHNIDRRQPGDRHHGRNARASSQNGLITAGPGAHGGGASSSSTGATSELDSRPAPGLGLHSLSPTLEQTPQVLSYDSDLPVGGGGVAAAVAAAAAATSQPAMLVKMERMGNPRRTPLHVAAERGQLHVLSAIIESLCCSATAAQLTEGTPSGTGSGDGDGGGGGGGHGRSSATGSVGGGAPAEAPGLLHPADFPHVNHQQQQQRYPQHPAPHAPPRNHPQQQQQRHTHQQGQHHPQQHHHQQPQPQLSRDRGQVGSSPAHGGGGGGGGTNPTSSGSPAPPMEEFPPLRPGAGGAPLAPEQFIQFHLNMQDVEGTTALSLACRFGHVDCCRLLLANGSARTLSDARGNTPLHYAALRGHLGVLFMLLDEFVEPGREEELAGYVDARNHAGCTPLHYAVWGRQSGSVQVLLQHGADVLPRNSRPAQELTPAVNVVGSTPLHLAAARGHVEICRIILKTFAERVLEPLQLTEDDPQPPTLASLDPRVQVNANGHMPYQVAQRLGFYPLAMLLRPSIPILRLFSDEERAIRFYGPAPLRAIAAEALNKKLLSELDALAAAAALQEPRDWKCFPTSRAVRAHRQRPRLPHLGRTAATPAAAASQAQAPNPSRPGHPSPSTPAAWRPFPRAVLRPHAHSSLRLPLLVEHPPHPPHPSPPPHPITTTTSNSSSWR
ncbi:hypothetical protein Agub_g15498 [Astrephomene gubernaculifera]|uniref:Uncharacterized protein n=1 Tax=Astrephomene gubernaculifera TaxID=47775 RepID=A0AAD3E377_9CHLO|nr:hypothetical protein Agub_g15498 [Astrephomene gubernaculifera]